MARSLDAGLIYRQTKSGLRWELDGSKGALISLADEPRYTHTHVVSGSHAMGIHVELIYAQWSVISNYFKKFFAGLGTSHFVGVWSFNAHVNFSRSHHPQLFSLAAHVLNSLPNPAWSFIECIDFFKRSVGIIIALALLIYFGSHPAFGFPWYNPVFAALLAAHWTQPSVLPGQGNHVMVVSAVQCIQHPTMATAEQQL